MKFPSISPLAARAALFVLAAVGGFAADPVTLHWLGDVAPAAPAGVSWGVPWPKGALARDTPMHLTGPDGQRVAVQTWPLAFWPDGSIKWSGHATVANATASANSNINNGSASAMNAPAGGTWQLTAGGPADPAPGAAIQCHEDDAAFTIDTGLVVARVPKHGEDFIDSLKIGKRVVAQHGHLIAQLEDRSRFASEKILREEDFTSQVDAVALEQSGPVRAVVKITGRHRATSGERAWLPFVVRLYFFAGSGEIRLTHSFIYDGDQNRDFIKGIGLAFSVPFTEELQNRHVRFVGDGEGVWAQPVRMLPGYRPQAGAQIGDLYSSHLGGQRVPNLADFDARSRSAILSVPVWGDAKLTQLGPNGFAINKRTTPEGSWLHVTDGHRSEGFALLGDVSGGLAVGVKDFWQKYPASLELTGGASPAGEIKVWLWSPEAEAMDLRHYDTKPHGLGINYEDWKPGWATPEGIANTADLTLWAFASIPSDAQLVAMARQASAPPILVCPPEYYHQLQVFGHWSLPDRSTPALRWVEDQVQGLVDFYHGQVEERSWYGFWDFGDIMHNYDFGRHDWRYDVGGWAWANTELMPDMLLWYSFLRTGRSDLFRMAEAMTRQTSEVEVYHLGPFAPLGSRHNVDHWGDGAKQPRISHSGLKQFYYFLTTDERVGDLMHEQLTADLTYSQLSQYNGSHYILNDAGEPVLEHAGSKPAPRPENLGPKPTQSPAGQQLGLEWMCYAMNWMMEWQRTGNIQWRDRVMNDMKTMSKGLNADGRLPGRYFDMIFGGPENMYEMEPMFDVPAFWQAWANTSADVGRQVGGSQMTGPRMLAYAAYRKNDAELGRLAWDKLIGPALSPEPQPKKITGVNIVKPVTDPAFLGAPVQWQLHGVASVQWALNAIETMELAKRWLPDWERAAAGKKPESAGTGATRP